MITEAWYGTKWQWWLVRHKRRRASKTAAADCSGAESAVAWRATCLLTQCYNKGYSGDVGMSRIRDMHAWLQADSSACKNAAFKHTASSAAHEFCCCVFHVATAHLDRS